MWWINVIAWSKVPVSLLLDLDSTEKALSEW